MTSTDMALDNLVVTLLGLLRETVDDDLGIAEELGLDEDLLSLVMLEDGLDQDLCMLDAGLDAFFSGLSCSMTSCFSLSNT